MTHPTWPVQLYSRPGSPVRLCGVRIYHDFKWRDRFSDNRTQFKNGQSLAKLAIEECPDGKVPALLLTADPTAQEIPIETDEVYAIVVRIDEYLQQQASDPAAAYYAQRSQVRITSLAQFGELPASPELYAAFLDQSLTVDHVSVWAESNSLRRSGLSALFGAPGQGVAATVPIVVNEQTKAQVIGELLTQGFSEDFWTALVDKDPRIATRLAAAQVELTRRMEIGQYRAAMSSHPSDEPFWESFFSRNPWALQLAFAMPVFKLGDETYLGGKRPIGPQGQGGVATDFLFSDESTKSFAVVEIKTPDTPLVGSLYRGSRDSDQDQEVYGMSSALSGAVVQTRNQIAVAVDDFDSILRRSFRDMNRVHASGVLLIGLASDLSERRLASFNLFRRSLHNLTVITFDELLTRFELLFEGSEDLSSPRGV